MRYKLFRKGTAHSVGHLAVVPEEEPGLAKAAELLAPQPMNDFLGKYLLDSVIRLDAQEFGRFCDTWTAPPLRSVLCTAAHLNPALSSFQNRFPDCAALARETSLIFLRSCLSPDQAVHGRFCQLLGENILDLRRLIHPDKVPLPDIQPADIRRVDLAALASEMKPASPDSRLSCQETIARAAGALAGAGLAADREMRHEASLSPVGLMRPWQAHWRVVSGAFDYTVTGVQIAFGRGMEIEQARAGYLMEMVERFSALPTVEGERIAGLAGPSELTKARRSELPNALDPNALGLEVPYEDECIHWIEGRDSRGEGILVPAQAVFPFINLDEPSLFSGLNTTGLGAGNTLEEARLSGLMEAVERDAEALGFHDPRYCFRLTSDDRHLRRYFRSLANAGVDVLVQNLRHESGIPCYKAFVTGSGGQTAKGAAASLSGPRAVLSAVTEIPCPLHGGRTRPAPDNLPQVSIEDLPDYSTGSAAGDLALAEAALRAMGIEPVWVDLTRKVLGIPVVRVLAPGLELVADFDRFSRATPRMMAKYREASGL